MPLLIPSFHFCTDPVHYYCPLHIVAKVGFLLRQPLNHHSLGRTDDFTIPDNTAHPEKRITCFPPDPPDPPTPPPFLPTHHISGTIRRAILYIFIFCAHLIRFARPASTLSTFHLVGAREAHFSPHYFFQTCPPNPIRPHFCNIYICLCSFLSCLPRFVALLYVFVVMRTERLVSPLCPPIFSVSPLRPPSPRQLFNIYHHSSALLHARDVLKRFKPREAHFGKSLCAPSPGTIFSLNSQNRRKPMAKLLY